MPKKKNTVGSVQIWLGVVGKKKEKKVLEVWISTRGGIIRNTYKL